MSQTSFLESVVQWDDAQCCQNLQHALPKLISHLQESTVLQEELGIMKMICSSFLPWVDIQHAEDMVFSHLTAQSCSMFEKTLQDLCELPKKSSYQAELHSLLQILLDILDCYSQCVCYAGQKGGNSVNIAHIHSLHHGAIHLLKGTYTHCKESSDVYGEVLACVTEPLSALFKKSHSLQQALLQLVEKVAVDDSVTNQDVQDLTAVCEGLFEVCQIVSSLDVKLVVSLWKAVSRLSSRHRNALRDTLNVDAMVTYLGSEVEKGFARLLQLAPPQEPQHSELSLSQGDSAAFQRLLKVVGYQLRVIISLLDNFIDHLSQCMPHVRQLAVTILRSVPPCLQPVVIATQYVEELKKHLVNGIEPLMDLVVTNRTFVKYVLSAVSSKESDDNLAWLLMLVRILDSLPKQQDDTYGSWMREQSSVDGTTNILHQTFTVTSRCHAELSVCTVQSPGNQRSLYEYICTHICGFVGSVPAKYFHTLETCVLEFLFSPYPLTSRLAQDVWCFIARYGSADLCYHHVNLCLSLCGEMGQIPCITRLAKRLLKFLSPEQQSNLLDHYPYVEHQPLWVQVFIPVLYNSLTAQRRSELVRREALLGIGGFLHKGDKEYDGVMFVTQCLSCLSAVLKGWDNNNNDNFIPDVLDSLTRLWLAWEPAWTGETILINCLLEMTESSGLIASTGLLSNKVFLKMFEMLLPLVKQESTMTQQDCTRVNLACCRLLQRCKKVTFQPDSQQPQVLKKLASLFHMLLLDGDPFVHHSALEAFTQFAETTVHETLIPECIGDNQELQDVVVAYLSKTQSGETIDYAVEVPYLLQQANNLHHVANKTLTQPAAGQSSSIEHEQGTRMATGISGTGSVTGSYHSSSVTCGVKNVTDKLGGGVTDEVENVTDKAKVKSVTTKVGDGVVTNEMVAATDGKDVRTADSGAAVKGRELQEGVDRDMLDDISAADHLDEPSLKRKRCDTTTTGVTTATTPDAGDSSTNAHTISATEPTTTLQDAIGQITSAISKLEHLSISQRIPPRAVHELKYARIRLIQIIDKHT